LDALASARLASGTPECEGFRLDACCARAGCAAWRYGADSLEIGSQAWTRSAVNRCEGGTGVPVAVMKKAPDEEEVCFVRGFGLSVAAAQQGDCLELP
jgi:hypothetical protein